MESRRWQISLKKDQVMQHLSHMLAWMFGPFVTKEARKELKHYGAIFTCLASQAIHLEAVNSMDTDSFMMCLRFIGYHGNVRMLRCDNGSNFFGARKSSVKASWRWMYIFI